MPILLKTDYILHLWLKEVPDYTSGFCQLVLIASLIATLSNLLDQVARAYGKIRKYQIVVSLFLFLNFPMSYMVLKLGGSPLATMWVNVGVQSILLFVRLQLTGRMIQMTCMNYLGNVLVRVFAVTIVSIVLPLVVCVLLGNSFASFVLVSLASICCVCMSAYILGMDKNEKQYVLSVMSVVIKKVKRENV